MKVIEIIKENAQANLFQKENFTKEVFTCLLTKKWKFFRSLCLVNVIETIKENAQENRFQKEHFMKEEFFTCLLPKKWKFFSLMNVKETIKENALLEQIDFKKSIS